MLKAALLTPNLSMGGAERWIVSLVQHMDPTRVQWTGVALSGWGGCDPELCAALASQVPVFSGPPRADVLAGSPPGRPAPALFNVPSDMLQEKESLPAAVRAAAAEADVLITWGGYRFDRHVPRGLPVVLVSHSSHAKPQPLTKKQGVSYLVAVSEAACAPFQLEGNPPVTVIHNGVAVQRMQPVLGRNRTRRRWGFNEQHRVVGYVGRFSHEKNPCAAIQAVQYLNDDCWRAVYFGELPARQQAPEPNLVQLAATTHDPLVRVYGHTPVVGDVYAGLDVLMLASHTEAFSMTMIEAWLAGVPIVATPVGAVPELEAKFGQLVIPVPLHPTAAQLAAACAEAVSPRGQIIAARAKDIALRHWTVETMVSRWADYLELIMAGKSPPVGLFTGTHRLRLDLDL
jgi:glycosyltransferase involved in cell wall biosynthesis